MQPQDMEAAGRLIEKVAHDFNNLLTTIIGNAELLVSTTQGQNRAFAEFILEAAERGTDLTRLLVTFSGQQPPKSTNADEPTVDAARR